MMEPITLSRIFRVKLIYKKIAPQKYKENLKMNSRLTEIISIKKSFNSMTKSTAQKKIYLRRSNNKLNKKKL